MNQCKDCGNMVSKSATTCPKCGRVFKSNEVARLILLLFIIVVVVLGIMSAQREEQKVKDATDRIEEARQAVQAYK